MYKPTLAVLGAGLMGIGIACHFARHGHRVRLYDTDPTRLAEVPAVAAAILHELQESGQFDAAHQQAVLARLTGTTSLSDLAESTLLIEAIPERLPLKHALYAQLETLIADDAIIASNTSGLPPDSLAAGMLHPQRLLIAHFWHPPHFIPLVEVVPGSATRPDLPAGERLFRHRGAGSGGASACGAGVRRQSPAVRFAARGAAYRPQRYRLTGSGRSGHARLPRPPLRDGRSAGGGRYDRAGDGAGYLSAPAAGAGRRRTNDGTGGGKGRQGRDRCAQRARILSLG